jgi:hypothetical protein
VWDSTTPPASSPNPPLSLRWEYLLAYATSTVSGDLSFFGSSLEMTQD